MTHEEEMLDDTDRRQKWIGQHVMNGWIAHDGNLYDPEFYRIVEISADPVLALLDEVEGALQRISLITDCAYADPDLRAAGARAIKRVYDQAEATMTTLKAFKDKHRKDLIHDPEQTA